MKIDIKNLENDYFKSFKKNNDYYNILFETFFGFNEIKEFFQKNDSEKSILEIGCGSAILLKIFSRNYPNLKFFGIDPFNAGFKKFKLFYNDDSNIKVQESKIENYKTNLKFDIIFSINVIEHVKDWKQYIISSNKLLKKGGKNIILCPNYDFPYESHYKIPIIFNKKITNFFFRKKITHQEIKEDAIGHWNDLNFIKKKKITNYLNKLNLDYYFDSDIKERIIKRMDYDKGLIKRQGLIGKLASISNKIKLDKFLFDKLKIPFPYMKLIINN